jgi:hypothetical protein
MNLNLSDSNNPDFPKDLFYHICKKKKKDFLTIVKLLTNHHDNSTFWMVTNPISRDSHNSNFFNNYCKVQLVHELVKEKKNIESIIINSKHLFDVIIQIPGVNKEIVLLNKNSFSLKIINIFYPFIYSIKEFLTKTWSLIIYKIFFQKEYNLNKKPIILIDTNVFPGYFSKSHYYKGILSYLNKNEKRNVFFFPTILLTKWNKIYLAFKTMVESEKNFLFKESHIEFIDIFKSTFFPIKSYITKIKPFKIKNIDYSPLIYNDLKDKSGYKQGIEALINYFFIKRLKSKKIEINNLINWWEGQALDKGLNKAMFDYYPNSNVIGYLGYAPRELELQLFPVKYENDKGIAPKKIATIGIGFKNKINEFNSALEVVVSPAFRFQHLWYENTSYAEKTNILVALPISFEDSTTIIDKIISINNHSLINRITFDIKPHPTVSTGKISNYYNNKLPENFLLTDSNIENLLPSSVILISGMSSVCLEAMASGIPVLVVEKLSNLKFNPIPKELKQDLWRECLNANDIKKYIKLFINRDNKEKLKHKELGLNIRKKYFEPVTRKSVLKFLNI